MLRAGELTIDSALIRRRLATLRRGTFASPDYIHHFGLPGSPDDLERDGHRMVGFYAPDAPEIAPFNFTIDDKPRRMVLPAAITVTGPETHVAAACLGLGLIQVPHYRVAADVATGVLVEVLADHPPTPLPVHVLYSHTRQLSPRLRVVIDWIDRTVPRQGRLSRLISVTTVS
jgi:DNA-binding transcriptional LysR family regulator